MWLDRKGKERERKPRKETERERKRRKEKKGGEKVRPLAVERSSPDTCSHFGLHESCNNRNHSLILNDHSLISTRSSYVSARVSYHFTYVRFINGMPFAVDECFFCVHLIEIYEQRKKSPNRSSLSAVCPGIKI